MTPDSNNTTYHSHSNSKPDTTKMKSNIVTITIEANWESQLIERLDQIRTAIKNGTLENNQLMDGSYQVGQSNIELEPMPA